MRGGRVSTSSLLVFSENEHLKPKTHFTSMNIDQQLLKVGICNAWSIGYAFEIPQ